MTRIKFLKRPCFGRAKFDLLRKCNALNPAQLLVLHQAAFALFARCADAHEINDAIFATLSTRTARRVAALPGSRTPLGLIRRQLQLNDASLDRSLVTVVWAGHDEDEAGPTPRSRACQRDGKATVAPWHCRR